MALNMIYPFIAGSVVERPVPSATQAGTAILINTRPAVTLTARGDSTATKTRADGSILTFPNGGVGNLPASASVVFTGTWEFNVTGASGSTAQETPVYITSATPGVLTLTSTGNTAYGFINNPRDYVVSGTKVCVRING